jgi:hypothetical protein
MKKLERVQRMTYRRMEQVDSELERFEERPELDTRKRYGALRKRFEELEKLYYNLRRKQAPDPHQLIARIFAEHSRQIAAKREGAARRHAATLVLKSREELMRREHERDLPAYYGIDFPQLTAEQSPSVTRES